MVINKIPFACTVCAPVLTVKSPGGGGQQQVQVGLRMLARSCKCQPQRCAMPAGAARQLASGPGQPLATFVKGVMPSSSSLHVALPLGSQHCTTALGRRTDRGEQRRCSLVVRRVQPQRATALLPLLLLLHWLWEWGRRMDGAICWHRFCMHQARAYIAQAWWGAARLASVPEAVPVMA